MHTLWNFYLQILQIQITFKIIIWSNILEWKTGESACTAAFPLCWNHWNTRNVKLCEGALHAYNCDLASQPNSSHRCILLKPHNAPLSRTGFDLNMCYFYLSFNRNVFIQHPNHETLQNLRLYHATIIKLHSLTRHTWVITIYTIYPDLGRHLQLWLWQCSNYKKGKQNNQLRYILRSRKMKN